MEWLTAGWDLFGPSYVVGWALAVALPLAGIPVVAREQARLGTGLVQMGAVGFAAALAFGLGTPVVWAFLAIAAATALAQRPPARERPEAVAAWMILAGGALTVLLLAGNAGGAEKLARLASSSVLGAGWGSAGVALAAALVVAVAAVAWGRRILVAAWEPRLARLQGVRPGLVGGLSAVVLALLLATALELSGALLTTALLVLPTLAARRFATRLAVVPWLAVGIAELAVTAGFALAWSADLPPGQVAVGLLGGVMVAAWAWPPSWRA
jgi:ABC-type Mn2+/Zn2+ transport system permease subunit